MSNQENELPIVFIGEKALLTEIHNLLKNDKSIIKIEDIKKGEENLKMNFSLNDASSFFTVIMGVSFILDKVFPVVVKSQEKSPKKNNKIILKTPKGIIEINSNSDIETVIKQLKSKI